MNVFELMGTIAIKNRDANAAIQDTTQRAERASSKISVAFKKIGEASIKIAKPIIAGATAAATAIAATVEKTRDYRTAMAQLDTAFVTNGFTAKTAYDTYKKFFALLGDTDQSVEAVTALALMCKKEEDLAKWTEICTGVFSVMQGKLPIEGLTEAANETAKVGVVTGNLADALNWAGINEDDFNLKLKACTSEEARQELIMNTLYWTYKAAADQYKETGKSVMEANAAQEKLNSAMAKLGEVGEPIMTAIKSFVADMVIASVPYLESMAQKLIEIASSADDALIAVQNFCNQKIIDPITGMLESMGNGFETLIGWADAASAAIANFFGIQRSGYMPTQSTDEYFAPSSGYLGEYANGWGSDYSFDGSHAAGLDRVPNDGYIARLHKDEAVLNSRDAAMWRSGEFAEIKALLTEMAGYMRAGQVIKLDSGIMAGQLAPAIDARLGTIQGRKGRGN